MISKFTNYIFDLFKDNGYEIYAVGGCVRDSILNIEPKDIDFCTNATPEQMRWVSRFIKYYSNMKVEIIPTGEKFGTLTFRFPEFDEQYEITCYRSDGRYTDGRHPNEVSYATTLEEDLKRRDFTCNAIAWNPIKGYVDPFNGISDIRNKIIRCVGNPEDRFNEDALRILRMIRFAIRYGFKVEEETLKAARRLVSNISYVSKERVGSEITQIFKYDLYDIDNLGIRGLLFSVLNNISDGFDYAEVLIATSVEERFFHLFSNCGIGLSRIKMNHLALGSKIVNFVVDVREAIDEQGDIQTTVEKRTALRHIHSDDEFKLFIKIMKQYHTTDVYDAFITPYVCEEPYLISHLAVKGNDIIEEFGVKGKRVGEMLNSALRFVCHNPNCNSKNKIIEYLRMVEFND